ncbi:hypothetical protein B0H11DRAFT_2214448 [Mycena galericulata]|nr:hypothetical protein B0H11DRAFT_2248479 [Mycena galericulata]KAJ7511563.1 hypothetical protein B0H11DRAFT_2214448 [Mycena galericulata]
MPPSLTAASSRTTKRLSPDARRRAMGKARLEELERLQAARQMRDGAVAPSTTLKKRDNIAATLSSQMPDLKNMERDVASEAPNPPADVDFQKGERLQDMDFTLLQRLKKGIVADREDDAETIALAEHMLAQYEAGCRDHLEDTSPIPGEVLSEDEYDPDSILPYVPRLKISPRRMNALSMINATIARLEAEADAARREERARRVKVRMERLAAQIAAALRSSKERVEVTAAPPGFFYVQVAYVLFLRIRPLQR